MHTAGPNQAITSAATLLVTVLASRALVPADFGVFSAVFIALFLIVGMQRAFVLQTVLLDPGIDTRQPLKQVRIRVVGTIASMATVAALVAAAAPNEPVRTAAFLLLAVAPSALYWDAVRAHYQGRHAHARLLYGDVVHLICSVGWVATWSAIGPSLPLVALGIGVGPLVASMVLLPPWSRRWVRRAGPWDRRRSRYLLADYVISTGIEQGMVLLSSAFLSVIAVGAIRLAQTAIGPATAAFLALETTVLPRLRDRRAAPRSNLRWAAPRFAVVAGTIISLGLGLSILPVDAGAALFGSTWMSAASVVVAVAARQSATALGAAAVLALRTSGRADTVFRIRLASLPLTVFVLLASLIYGDLFAFVWSIAGLQVLNTIAFCYVAGRNSHERKRPSTPA